MPEWLSRYIGLPEVRAEDIGIVGEIVCGEIAHKGGVIVPLARALPMGFAWGLFCQRIGEDLCSQVPVLRASVPLGDCRDLVGRLWEM